MLRLTKPRQLPAHGDLQLQQQHPRWAGPQTHLPAAHRCRLHGNAGSPNKSRAVCAQPRPLSTDTPTAANQLVARERQAWCVTSVCVFLRVCVGTETHPRHVDPVKGRSGAPGELQTQRKKAEETLVCRHLLRERSTFSSRVILQDPDHPGPVWRHQDVFGAQRTLTQMFLQETLEAAPGSSETGEANGRVPGGRQHLPRAPLDLHRCATAGRQVTGSYLCGGCGGWFWW